MLRLTTLVLILANAGFFAWQAGWLGAGAPGKTDLPRGAERARQQVNPDQLIVLGHADPTASAATREPSASAGSAPDAPAWPGSPPAASGASGAGEVAVTDAAEPASEANGQCVEAGPFTQDEQRQANAMLARILQPGQWGTQNVAVPGLWLVYMGPYPDDDSLARKEAELRRIRNLPFEEVRSPATLARGLSLGKFTDERQANAALETLRLRGIRTARVVNARPAMELQVLRAPAVDLGQKAQLQKLPLPAGKGFIDCNG